MFNTIIKTNLIYSIIKIYSITLDKPFSESLSQMDQKPLRRFEKKRGVFIHPKAQYL